MNNIVIRRIREHPVDSPEGIGENLSCRLVLRKVHLLEAGMMGFRKNPGFERETGGEGCDGEERFIFSDNPVFLLKLLPNDVAKDAPILIVEICLGPFNLFAQPPRDDGEGDDLRMRMFQRRPCGHAVVFKYKDVPKTLVSPEIDDPIAVGQKDIPHIF